MRRSYLDYSMSVIIGRALPDVRDGLKPVHRRILYAMHSEGLHHNKRYSKCAGVVGEVLKKYHPHGDASVYDALVRLAQPWNLRYPLIDGQGNFGSVDGDPAAAYRYTESRLEKLADYLLADIDKETVEWAPNFDDSTVEPVVLPARFPNLLVNGSAGIAVGMATNIPPHNMGEVIARGDPPGPRSPGHRGRADALHPRPRLPHRRDDPGARRHPPGLRDRPRQHHRACTGLDRGPPQDRARGHRRHRDPLPGEQGQARREHRRPGAGEADRGHLRPARRVVARGHAGRRRAEARRDGPGGAEQPLPAHHAADQLRRSSCSPSTAASRASSR